MKKIVTFLVVLFIGVSLFVSCDENHDSHNHEESIIEKISIEDLPEITGFLYSQKSLVARNSNMSILDSISNADVIVIEEENGLKSYTFGLTIAEPSTQLTNLVVNETLDGFEYFTVTYESEHLETWKQELANNQEPTIDVEITKYNVSNNSSRGANCEDPVTRYTCPSGQHSGALQGDCVYPHTDWSYKVTFMSVPCDNQGGGSSGGGGSTGSTSPNTGNTPTPNQKEFAKIKNVINTKTSTTDPSETYKDKLVNLAPTVSDVANENGRYLTNTNLVGSCTPGFTVKFLFTINYKAISHTHNNDPNGKYSIFSFEDLMGISELLHKGKINGTDFVATLSTSKGTHYALTIADVNKFKAFFYAQNNDGTGANQTQWWGNYNTMSGIKDKYYNNETNPLISQTDTKNANVLEKFLDMLNESDMGLALFETNANFTTFTRVTKSTSSTTIIRESFNL